MAPAAMSANPVSEYAPTGGKGGSLNNALSNYTGSTNPASIATAATPAFPQYSQSAGGQTSGGQLAAPQRPNMFQQASNAINTGMAGAYGEMGYNPMMIDPSAFSSGVGAGYDTVDPNAFNWEAAQTQQADLDRFYNPYVNQVVDTSLSDIDRARQMQQNQAAAQAQAAGAFGGSRGALMETEIGRNALDQAARTGSQLRSAGFTQAANLAQQDVARRQQASQINAAQQMQAMLANQSAGLQASIANSRVGQANAQNALQAMLANQGMQLAGSGQRLAAGQQLANIGNLGFGQAQDVQSNFQQQGAMQQALQQQLLDAAKQQYAGYTGAGNESLQNLIAAISGAPIPSSTSQSSTPGLLDIAQTGALLYMASDKNLKKEIKKVGELGNGLNVYTWKWNDESKDVISKNQPEIGVIAQEVQEVMPEAVVRGDHGYLMVNYGALI